jgi:hypothetical protein
MARQVDLAHHTLADQPGTVRLHYFAHEFVTRRAGESIVAALQFEVGIADPTVNQTNEGESARTPRFPRLAHLHSAIFKMDG